MSDKRRGPKRSNVRAIGRMACPCGWPAPVNIGTVGFVPLAENAAITFDCPQCGRGLKTASAPELAT